tara:strand:- start:2102 stop:2248 length:147 start_codon:yes stop_codon:yes gene_type:complete
LTLSPNKNNKNRQGGKNPIRPIFVIYQSNPSGFSHPLLLRISAVKLKT